MANLFAFIFKYKVLNYLYHNNCYDDKVHMEKNVATKILTFGLNIAQQRLVLQFIGIRSKSIVKMWAIQNLMFY